MRNPPTLAFARERSPPAHSNAGAGENRAPVQERAALANQIIRLFGSGVKVTRLTADRRPVRVAVGISAIPLRCLVGHAVGGTEWSGSLLFLPDHRWIHRIPAERLVVDRQAAAMLSVHRDRQLKPHGLTRQQALTDRCEGAALDDEVDQVAVRAGIDVAVMAEHSARIGWIVGKMYPGQPARRSRRSSDPWGTASPRSADGATSELSRAISNNTRYPR